MGRNQIYNNSIILWIYGGLRIQLNVLIDSAAKIVKALLKLNGRKRCRGNALIIPAIAEVYKISHSHSFCFVYSAFPRQQTYSGVHTFMHSNIVIELFWTLISLPKSNDHSSYADTSFF